MQKIFNQRKALLFTTLTLLAGLLAISFALFSNAVNSSSAEAKNTNDAPVWSLVGSITGDYSWSTDFDLTYEDASGLYTLKNKHLLSGEFKIRYNHDWATSLGGTYDCLTHANGANLHLDTEQNYDIYLDLAGGKIMLLDVGTTPPTPSINIKYELGKDASGNNITFKADNQFMHSVNETHITGTRLILPLKGDTSIADDATINLISFSDKTDGTGSFTEPTDANWVAPITADTTLYAIYDKQYSIDYDLPQGASWAQGYTPVTSYAHSHIDPSTITLPTEDNMQFEGHTFVGWYDNAEFSGDPITSFDPKMFNDLQFYAKWEEAGPTTHTVSGKLLDSDSKPVSGIQVTFTSTEQTVSTTTDDKGEFQLEGLIEGTTGIISFVDPTEVHVVLPITNVKVSKDIEIETNPARKYLTSTIKCNDSTLGLIKDEEGNIVKGAFGIIEGTKITTKDNVLTVTFPDEFSGSYDLIAVASDGCQFDSWSIKDAEPALMVNDTSDEYVVKNSITITAEFSKIVKPEPEPTPTPTPPDDNTSTTTGSTTSTSDATPLAVLFGMLAVSSCVTIAIKKRYN